MPNRHTPIDESAQRRNAALKPFLDRLELGEVDAGVAGQEPGPLQGIELAHPGVLVGRAFVGDVQGLEGFESLLDELLEVGARVAAGVIPFGLVVLDLHLLVRGAAVGQLHDEPAHGGASDHHVLEHLVGAPVAGAVLDAPHLGDEDLLVALFGGDGGELLRHAGAEHAEEAQVFGFVGFTGLEGGDVPADDEVVGEGEAGARPF